MTRSVEGETSIMPIYEYQAKNESASCPHCTTSFEVFQKLSDPPLEKCPQCAAPVCRLISTHSVGSSRSGFDARAKSAGFHKLVKRDKGTYEKTY